MKMYSLDSKQMPARKQLCFLSTVDSRTQVLTRRTRNLGRKEAALQYGF